MIQGNYGYRAPAPMGFGRENSPFSSMGAQGILDRMARYSEFAEMEYCLIGSTKIATPDGYKTIQELADTYGLDKTFIVYSYDHTQGKIVPSVGKQARKTRHDHAWKVTFDSGHEIIGTANHRLMKRDGSYVEIQDLHPNDSMMPFYRRDFYNEERSDTGAGYRWIYDSKKFVLEHKLIAEWTAGRSLTEDEVVHHINYIKNDNRPENLKIMSRGEHTTLHNNEQKWSEENSEWIEKFKEQHSAWMKQNNPAERQDVTFEKILYWCDTHSFNLYKVAKAFDTDHNTIKRKLRTKGFENWISFAKTYSKDWKSESWDNVGGKNPRYNTSVTFEKICNLYQKGTSQKKLAQELGVSITPLNNRLREAGYDSWSSFTENYQNHKVVKVEYYGKIDLYDLTVDGYKNFATDSVISHNTPEIATALDIYADETVGGDDRGKAFHVYSKNPEIKKTLDELFYDILNVEFNLRPWARNLVKFGDFFLFNEVVPDIGVINAVPIPVNELEREEGFDEQDPYAVRFKWITRGNQYLENWQVTHLRILGNDLFLPYGSSVLEPGRRIWRQLIMMEDSMLVYRIVRSPERRVFYIDVGAIAPNDIPAYMEAAKATLRSNTIVDKQTGRTDMRYNPLSVDEDYFIPVRGTQAGTRVETLAGGTNATAVEDVEYIQKKLFAALKVPKPYLNYDEQVGAKATLAQEDVRFSRTIGSIQKIFIAELNKLAMIHLYARGFDGEDLINFELKLSNPSTIALQQRLELWSTKFDIGASAKETMLVDENWIQKNILELTDEDIISIGEGRREDKINEVELEAVEAQELVDQQNKTIDQFDPNNYEMGGEAVEKTPPPSDDESAENILNRIKSYDEDGNPYHIDYKDGESPLKANPRARSKHNRRRRVKGRGADNLASPDFAAMLHPGKNRSLKDLYDKRFLDNPLGEEIQIHRTPMIPSDVKSLMRRFDEAHPRKTGLINEVDLKLDDDKIVLENLTLTEDDAKDVEEILDESEIYDESLKTSNE